MSRKRKTPDDIKTDEVSQWAEMANPEADLRQEAERIASRLRQLAEDDMTRFGASKNLALLEYFGYRSTFAAACGARLHLSKSIQQIAETGTDEEVKAFVIGWNGALALANTYMTYNLGWIIDYGFSGDERVQNLTNQNRARQERVMRKKVRTAQRLLTDGNMLENTFEAMASYLKEHWPDDLIDEDDRPITAPSKSALARWRKEKKII